MLSYYVYGLLHSKDYRERFAADLRLKEKSFIIQCNVCFMHIALNFFTYFLIYSLGCGLRCLYLPASSRLGLPAYC